MFVNCPTCNREIEIVKVNCGVFRCGIYKKSYRQLGSHAKEKYVKKLLENDKIIGCGNPFRYSKTNGVKKCGWV